MEQRVLILLKEDLVGCQKQTDEILTKLQVMALDGQVDWLDTSLAHLDGVVFARLASPRVCTSVSEIPGVSSVWPDNVKWIKDA